MRLLRKLAGFFGLGKDDSHEVVKDQDDETDTDTHAHVPPNIHVTVNPQAHLPPNLHETRNPRRGFGVKVQVAVDRPQSAPVILPSASGDGGVQGLKWYGKRLKVDEDGDVADEFLDEVLRKTSTMADEQYNRYPHPKYEVKHRLRQVKVNKQIMSDGRLQQYIEHQGRLQLV